MGPLFFFFFYPPPAERKINAVVIKSALRQCHGQQRRRRRCAGPALSQWDRRISELKQTTHSLCLRGVAEFSSPSPSSRALQRPADPPLVRDAFHSGRFCLADTLCFYFRTGIFETTELFILPLESQNIFVNAGFV